MSTTQIGNTAVDRRTVLKTGAAILSGANVNFARLRHIAERAAVGEEQEALLGVTIPERPGSFLDFCQTVGLRGITEFNYRYSDNSDAHIFVGIALKNGMEEKSEIMDELNRQGLPVIDLSSNDMARLHIRHMVGGRADVRDERILRFEFPERPGALLRFLFRPGGRFRLLIDRVIEPARRHFRRREISMPNT